MFTHEKIRILNIKGEKHGTITARINHKENFEITSLHFTNSEVEFTTDWLLDASRRDLTINSMFLGLDGSLYDYFYGFNDLQQRKCVFVGDTEFGLTDSFIILRYFSLRFYGILAETPDNHDEKTLQIICKNAWGLEKVARERLWSELKKILEGRFAGELLKTMVHVGVAKYFGLSDERMSDFLKLWQRSGHLKLKAVTLLSGLICDVDDVLKINQKLRMSSYDRSLALFIIRNRNLQSDNLMSYQKLVLNGKHKVMHQKEWTCELLKYQGLEEFLKEFSEWEIPCFPISGILLREKYNVTESLIKPVINELKLYWVDREFKPDVDQLFAQVPDIVSEKIKKITFL